MTGSTRRTRRFKAVTVATFGVASIAAAAAFGHVPGVGNGLSPVTAAPDLVGVAVAVSDFDDGVPELARLCFDANVSTINPAALAAPADFVAFWTYDSRRIMQPISLTKDTSDERCIFANFPNGTDLQQATVGTLVNNTVRDLQSRGNRIASEPVAGSVVAPRAGATTGPDLLTAVPNTALETGKFVVYTFDENLDPATPPNAAAFGFFGSTGGRVNGSSVTFSGSRAIVQYGSAPLLADSSRFVADSGAVRDRPQQAAVPPLTLFTASAPGAKGATSTRPELISAQPIQPQKFKLTFSEDIRVSGVLAGGFQVISDDGTVEAGASDISIVNGDTKSVIATFGQSITADPSGLAKILVDAGSIASIDGSESNVASESPIGTPNSTPGLTNGPDLLSAVLDPATNSVTYRYDEAVGDGVLLPGPAAFKAYANDGAEITAASGVVVSSNTVTATFPNSVGTAVMFSNEFFNLFDKTGRPNVHQSVNKAIQTAPPPPPPPPLPPGGGTPPPPIGPPNANPGVKTTVTITRRGRRYFGTVKSARKACRQGRRVILKRRGNQARFGSRISSRTGRYSITRKRRLRGRVYVFVTARKTASTNCRSGKSRTIRG